MHADDATHDQNREHFRVVRHVTDLKFSKQQLCESLRIIDELHGGKTRVHRAFSSTFFFLHVFERSFEFLLLLLFG